jgi:hypothetical protein
MLMLVIDLLFVLVNFCLGMKLVFNPSADKPKAFEIFEKDKLTIK